MTWSFRQPLYYDYEHSHTIHWDRLTLNLIADDHPILWLYIYWVCIDYWGVCDYFTWFPKPQIINVHSCKVILHTVIHSNLVWILLSKYFLHWVGFLPKLKMWEFPATMIISAWMQPPYYSFDISKHQNGYSIRQLRKQDSVSSFYIGQFCFWIISQL